MHPLPTLTTAHGSWCLPLSDDTALRLAEALLTDDSREQAELTTAAMGDDPVLSLWTVCSAWSADRAELSSLGAIAQWLLDAGLPRLEVETPRGAARQRDVAAWRDSVLQSLTARMQCEVAQQHGHDTARPENHHPQPRLVALLHNARQYLELAGGDGGEEVAMSRALLPPWLANASEGGKNIVTSAAKIDPPIRQSAEAMSRQWAARIPRAAEIYARVLQHVAAPQRDFEARLRREKLASLKQFTYGASHELNNPLFNISSRAQVLLRDEQNPERRRKLSTIYSHAMRASEMIKEMALAAHPPQPAVERCRIAEVLRGVVAELSQQAREQHAVVELAADADSSFEIDADPTQIAVAVREICLNALAALQRASRPGKVTLSVHPIGRDAIEITVRDDGPGLDARTRRHLFDPFFSGYESGRGLGFGLTKCWQIIDAHGGRIDVESRTGEGTVFAIRLPASAPRPRAAD